MKTFTFLFTETLNTTREYQAETEEEAYDMARDAYGCGDVTLSSDDYSGHYEIERVDNDDSDDDNDSDEN